MLAAATPAPVLEAVLHTLREPPAAYVADDRRGLTLEEFVAKHTSLIAQAERSSRENLAFLRAGLVVIARGLKEGKVTLEQIKQLRENASKGVAEVKTGVDELLANNARSLEIVGQVPERAQVKRVLDRLSKGAIAYHDDLVGVYYKISALALEHDPEAREPALRTSDPGELATFLDGLRAA